MHAPVYLPLVIAGLFGLTAPRLALRMPLGFTLVGQAPTDMILALLPASDDSP